MSRSHGHSALAAAAYRAGVCLTCERTGKAYDYRSRQGVVEAAIVVPVGNITPERQCLWSAAERAEKRKNSRVAREWLFSLPVELSSDGRRAAVRRVADHLVARHGVVVDYAIHAPTGGADRRNHHAHLLMTTRRLENGQLTAKTRELDDKATGAEIVKDWRKQTAAILNAQIALEEEQRMVRVRVEHRSFAERGIEQEPTKHRGKTEQKRQGGRLAALFKKVAGLAWTGWRSRKTVRRFEVG